jgi:hypothetical protein
LTTLAKKPRKKKKKSNTLKLKVAFPAPPNPTQAAFMASAARHQLIMGPPGCGKSEASLRKLEALAAWFPNNEVVIGSRVRLDVVQNTLPHFWRIATPELYVQFPQLEKFVNKHDMVLRMHNGSYIRFTGLADSGDFGSANLGAIGFMELYHPLGGKNIRPEVYFAGDKALRNPNANFRCIISDTNRIPRNHWMHEEFGENGKPGHECFFPTWEENKVNLPEGHVREMERTWTTGQRAQMMEPGWGQVISGKPVYGEAFQPGLHVNADLEPDPDKPVWISFDSGYVQPWAHWSQEVGGCWHMLGEINPRFVMLDKFVDQMRQYTEEYFPDCAIRYASGDDVIQHKDTGIALDTLNQYGIRPVHRPTRSVRDEVERIIRYMSRIISGTPALQVHPRCENSIEMFTTGYRWSENKAGIVRDVPLKDGYFDHCADSARHFAINVLGIVPSGRKRAPVQESFANYGSGLGQPVGNEAFGSWN